jgi:diaminohydroxyphosphoribosylaminopyrimidine deaminase/5-amino-6-(5-phosphoribosylamino)uracil reductase
MVSHDMNQLQTDEKYMRRCIQLAVNGKAHAKPNPMVGAVIVANGRIIGEGYHIRCGDAHAEVNAFASVKPEDESLLKQSTIYVSLEPCAHFGKTPPCCDLIIKKGVNRVVVGCTDSFAKVQGRGIQRIREAGIEVTVGVLENECRELNKRFFIFHEKHRPFIILKWAQTVNGFIDDHGQALAISTPFTKMLNHRLRAEEDAILVGRVTDEREHPLLNVRDWKGDNPIRIVLKDGMNIHQLMDELYHQNVQSLIVEGGRKTLTSFMEANLWDEIRVETAPITVSDGTKAPILPEAQEYLREEWDGNTIVWYRCY